MELKQAQTIAGDVLHSLSQHCTLIQVAGSVRRGKPVVKDIEIVCIPCTVSSSDLFGNSTSLRAPAFGAAVKALGEVVKGDPNSGKAFQVLHPDGITLDIFTATEENWGLILAIRTGSAEYSHKVLATGWVKAGYKSIDGTLHKAGRPIPVPDEQTLFNLIGLPYASPENRNL